MSDVTITISKVNVEATAKNSSITATLSGATIPVAGSSETAASIKTKYESNADTNAFTDADHTKLDGIEEAATADQTGAEIKSALEGLTGANRLDSSAIKNLSSGDVRQFEHTYHGRVRSMVVVGSSVKFDVTYGWRGDWDDTWFGHNNPLYNDKGFYVNADSRIIAVKFVIQWSSTAAANLRFRLSNWTPIHNTATVTNHGDTNGIKDIELDLDIGSNENNRNHILTATNTDFQSGGSDITIPAGSYIGPHLRIDGSSTANGVHHPCMLSIITEEV